LLTWIGAVRHFSGFFTLDGGLNKTGRQIPVLSTGILLRIEGAALFALCLYGYRLTGAGWGLFLLLFLWPDLFLLGYLGNVRLGATLYNGAHMEALPVLLAGVAYAQHREALLAFALIGLAHIALDRALGFGLKYPTFFKDTHLQRVDGGLEAGCKWGQLLISNFDSNARVPSIMRRRFVDVALTFLPEIPCAR